MYKCIHTYASVDNLATSGHNLCPFVIMVHHMAPCPCCTALTHGWGPMPMLHRVDPRMVPPFM